MSASSIRDPLSIVAAAVAVLTLVIAVPGAAVAQEERYRATGQASGFAVDLPGDQEIVGGRTIIEIASEPLAFARGIGLLTVDSSISEVRIEQPGVSRRDPESGNNCATPELPEPLTLVDVACSFVEGATLDSLPTALSDGSGLGAELTGADATAMVDFLLGHIESSGLTDAIREAEAQVLDPVRTALAEACLEAVGGEVGDGINEAGALISAIKDETGISAEIEGETACDLLLKYTLDPPLLVGEGEESSADALLALLRDSLVAALEDVSLLDLLLGGSTSDGATSPATVVGSATSTGVDIALPSLNLLGNVVEVITTLVGAYVGDVESDVGDVISFEDLDIPSVAALVDTVLTGVPEDLQAVLDEDDPLLRITGGHSEAAATFNRGSGEATTDGQVAPLVIDLAETLAALLGDSDQDPITVTVGNEVTLAEGTPLETTVKLAACSSEEATHDGLDGARISCDGLELVLLKGLVDDDPETEEPDGGLRVAAAGGQAAAFGAPGAPIDEPALPVTGGGAALAALALLSAALTLRRRR